MTPMPVPGRITRVKVGLYAGTLARVLRCDSTTPGRWSVLVQLPSGYQLRYWPQELQEDAQ
jgi:hypothetical protein